MARSVTHRYIDPLAEVWLGVARRIGLRVIRTADAYAATDGAGTLAIATDDALDADDSLAQMIFHELCHSLVEGEASFTAPDWGMDNTGPDHDWREHACLRTQWVLCARHGLGAVFAPTTEFRAFWDTLGGAAADVLADRRDRSVLAAIRAVQRAAQPPWAPALADGLAATAEIAGAAARFRGAPAPGTSPTLWTGVTAPPAPHPTGLPAGNADATCATCAWRFEHRGAVRCRQAQARTADAYAACERYEPAASIDCQTCGACCREAYHSVEVGLRDPMRRAHPELVVDRGTYLEVARSGDRCAALVGGEPEGTTTARYRCTIYGERPRTCREFTAASANCLIARKRVALSL